MRTDLRCFARQEDGAVTVDWVVLTAAIVGLCIGLVATLNDETTGMSQRASDFIDAQEPGAVGRMPDEDG